jgi:hypothetical protein
VRPYVLSENLLPPATRPGEAPPGELRWKLKAAFLLVLAAVLAAFAGFITARAGRLGLALVSAPRPGVLGAAGVVLTVFAVDWSRHVPGAGGAFAAAGAAVVGLVVSAAVLAREAVPPPLSAR